MPKLIVQDGEKKRAFRLSKGRLTIGSAATNKLVLESSGTAEQHAVLVVKDDGVVIDALAPLEIDGRKVSGNGLAVPIGSTLRLGGAVLSVAADAGDAPAATSAAAVPAAKPAAAGTARAAAGARSAAPAAKAGAKKATEPEPAIERKSRRAAAKDAKPKWMMPTIVGIGLVLLAFAISLMKGGNEEGLINQGLASLSSGDLQHARSMLDQVDPNDLKPKVLESYNQLKTTLENAENEAAVGPVRGMALKWMEQHLTGYRSKFLSAEVLAKASPFTPDAKKRLWLSRFDEFARRYPDHASPEWAKNSAWATAHAEMMAARQEFMAVADTSRAPTDADIEWALFYYTDPGAKQNRRFDLARAELERYASGGGSATMLQTHRATLEERAVNYANAQIELARKFYDNAGKQGGEINDDYLKSASYLIEIAMVVGVPEKTQQALDMLAQFPNIDRIMLSYVNGAEKDDSAADKVAFLATAGARFAMAIDKAREELAARAAEAAARAQAQS